MKGLARTDQEAIVYKLFVLAENGAFYNPVASIKIIVEEWMADIFHVDTDLVGPAGFQNTFYQGYIVKPLQNFVVCHRFFPMIAFRVGFK